MNTAAEDVVLGDHLFNIKSLLQTLEPMGRRAAFCQRFRNCFAGSFLECGGNFIQEIRDVIIERRNIEMLRRGELLYLLPPSLE